MSTVLEKLARSMIYLLLYTLIFFACLLVLPRSARADGGAPNLAYVAGADAGISVVDVAAAKVAKTIALSGDPHTILLSLNGRFLYVTQPHLDQVSIIEARTGKSFCSAHILGAPTFLAWDQSTTLYVAGNRATSVSAIDTTNCTIKQTYQIDTLVNGLTLAGPQLGLPTNSTMQLWVAGTTALTIFDINTGKIIDHITIAGGPQYLTAPPGVIIYATTRQGSVVAVDFQRRAVHVLLSGGTYGPMDYDALTGQIYVPDQKNKWLAVLSPLDPASAVVPREPERVLRTDGVPVSVAITNDGLIGFVALQDGRIVMYDLLARLVAYTLQVGGHPHFCGVRYQRGLRLVLLWSILWLYWLWSYCLCVY
ncbi:MAG: hypothetical protein E6J34_13145 [Chloroflexi bacterium]|nr:MAG: hypothetical protein E6J34_13145 [Chloroflexota bacterium]